MTSFTCICDARCDEGHRKYLARVERERERERKQSTRKWDNTLQVALETKYSLHFTHAGHQNSNEGCVQATLVLFYPLLPSSLSLIYSNLQTCTSHTLNQRVYSHLLMFNHYFLLLCSSLPLLSLTSCSI